MWEGRIQIKRSQQILWTKTNEVKLDRHYAQVPKISTAQILKEKDLLKDGYVEKDPSNLASLKLMMSPQNCVDAWKANAILSPINRVLLSRFNLDSGYSILWSMTAFSKVWNIPCYMGVWWSHILSITFSGFPFKRRIEFISMLKVVTSAVIKAFLNYFSRKWLFGFCFLFLCFYSVSKSCPTLCHSTDCSTPGFPVLHHLLEFGETHVDWVGDAIQPSHPLSPPSPPALNLSQHQGLFQWVGSSHQVVKVLEFQLQHQSFQWIFRIDFL